MPRQKRTKLNIPTNRTLDLLPVRKFIGPIETVPLWNPSSSSSVNLLHQPIINVNSFQQCGNQQDDFQSLPNNSQIIDQTLEIGGFDTCCSHHQDHLPNNHIASDNNHHCTNNTFDNVHHCTNNCDMQVDDDEDDGYDFIFETHREHILDLIATKFNITRSTPLHPGSNVLYVTFIFDLLQLFSSSQLAKTEMTAMLNLLNANFKDVLTKPLFAEVDTLFKKITDIKKEFKRIYYCNCDNVEHVCDEEAKCPVCKKKSPHSIWVKSISSWITGFIDTVGGIDKFRKLTKPLPMGDKIEDVTHSLEYERIKMDWNLGENSLPLTISIGTDGGKVFKSSSNSVWPLFGWVNEFSMSLRYSYPFTMLLGYCSRKVDMNFFLRYLVDELLQLNKKEGIGIKTDKGQVTLNVRLLMVMSDLVAISEIFYLNGASGYSCCRWCDAFGRRLDDRIVFGSYVGSKRDWKKILEFYKRLAQDESCPPHEGIKMKSILVELPYFCWTTQVACDILHNLLEGLCKKVTKEIVKQYDVTEINKKIDQVSVPSMYHRNLRNLSDLGHYKAIEYYMLYGYNVHVFEGTVNAHHMQCLNSIELLIEKAMSPIRDGDKYHCELFKECLLIIDSIDKAFGKHITTLSTHTVTHFADSLTYLGPLYLTSTFMLEDLVGRIIKPIQGGKHQMDHKALQMWSVMQKVSIKKYRLQIFQLEKNDYLHSTTSGGYFQIVKKPNEKHPAYVLKKFDNAGNIDASSTDLELQELPEDSIPCFKGGRGFQARRADKFLL